MNRYIISDTHFYHENIIKYENRPFKTVDEMNKTMINRWNSKVKKDDLVYHLGDFGLSTKENLGNILSKLNGRIVFILGNHDKQIYNYYRNLGRFELVTKNPIIIERRIILSHEPFLELGPFKNFYGHVHGCPDFQTITDTGCCVCVERWDYTPISLDRLLLKFKK